MIYRISLENIREQIEDVLILDKWKMTKNEEQIKYLTEKRHYRKRFYFNKKLAKIFILCYKY